MCYDDIYLTACHASPGMRFAQGSDKMSRINYHDVFWDFTSVGNRGSVRVRELEKEEELFSRELGDGEDGGYACQLPLSKRSIHDTYREDRWARRRIDKHIMGLIGESLWNCLPEDLKSSLVSKLGNTSRPVRLKISGDSTIINDLTWELLKPPGEPHLALRDDVRLCRSVPVLIRSPAMTVSLPVRMLVIVTNPKDSRLLIADQEISAITSELLPEQYSVRVIEDPTPEGLSEEVADYRPSIIHYIGHAGISHGDGHLILQSLDGRTSWVSPIDVSSAMPDSVRLVCLSTCFTVTNYQLLGLLRMAFADARLELPTVIANQYPLDGQSVAIFWSTFYSALVECGGDTCEAVHRARVATQQGPQSIGDWGSFAHVLRDSTGDVFRFRQGEDTGPNAVELKAQFAAQLANELAEQLRKVGSLATHNFEVQARTEFDRARKLLKDLGDGEV